jgi:hypothetical protein
MKRIPGFSFITKLGFRAITISTVIFFILLFLTVRCKIAEEDVLTRYLEFRERVDRSKQGKQWKEVDDFLNSRINASPKLLQRKITLVVDRALADYEEKEPVNITMTSPIVLGKAAKLGGTQRLILEQAIYYELSDGTMGIRGSWTKPWPNEIVTVFPPQVLD